MKKTMESPDSYLCFHRDESSYIVPVMEVERICRIEDTAADQELRWLCLSEREECRQQQERQCVVILREETGRYAVAVDLVEGVLEIAPSGQFEVPDSLQRQYPWLLGAALPAGEDRLLLLLNGQELERLTDGEEQDGEVF